MIYLDDPRRKPDYGSLRCTCCGADGMRYHETYRRHLVDLSPGGVPVETTVHVDRVRCPACGRTHALLGPDMVAYSPVSVPLAMAVVSMCLDASAGPRAAAERLGVCLTACRRLAGDAARLCAFLSCSFFALSAEAAALAADRGRCARGAAGFARLHSTTPFSAVALANWARRSSPRPGPATQARAPGGGVMPQNRAWGRPRWGAAREGL